MRVVRCAKQDGTTMQAERGYRQGLVMYPKNPALLRSYAQFMQDVKLNPNASMRYWVEADKLEAQQTEVCLHAVVITKACLDKWVLHAWSLLFTSVSQVLVTSTSTFQGHCNCHLSLVETDIKPEDEVCHVGRCLHNCSIYVTCCVSGHDLHVCMQSRKESMLTKIDAVAMDAETVQMLSIIDGEKDANVIINAEGLIQFANKGVASVSL